MILLLLYSVETNATVCSSGYYIVVDPVTSTNVCTICPAGNILNIWIYSINRKLLHKFDNNRYVRHRNIQSARINYMFYLPNWIYMPNCQPTTLVMHNRYNTKCKQVVMHILPSWWLLSKPWIFNYLCMCSSYLLLSHWELLMHTLPSRKSM